MIIIEIKDGEAVDKALKRYKKKFERLGILKQVRKKMFFTPPCVAKKNVIKKAQRRTQYVLENGLL